MFSTRSASPAVVFRGVGRKGNDYSRVRNAVLPQNLKLPMAGLQSMYSQVATQDAEKTGCSGSERWLLTGLKYDSTKKCFRKRESIPLNYFVIRHIVI